MKHRVAKVQKSLILWNGQSRRLFPVTTDNVRKLIAFKDKKVFIEGPVLIPSVWTGLYFNPINFPVPFHYVLTSSIIYFLKVSKLLED